MNLKPLPLGRQHFQSLIEDGCLYVDKTKYLCDLIKTSKFNFLSRPRRFGKSLSLSTMMAMFENKKELFKGLYAEDHFNWGVEYPVFHIQFNELNYEKAGLEYCLSLVVKNHAVKYNIEIIETEAAFQFKELIVKLSKFNKVVILIDEYDKPMIDYLTKDVIHKAKENRDILRSFYGVLKASDEYLKFVFITGISKFAQTGIFSQLNNINDITRSFDFGAIVGYSQEELEYNYRPYLLTKLQRLGLDEEQAWINIKKWYNGYTWNLIDHVYNPFSLTSFMQEGAFVNYWYLSGAPKFLIDLLKEKEIFEIEKSKIDEYGLNSYDIENLSPTVLMYQTGYLTFKSKNKFGIYQLDYPNKEVKDSTYKNLLSSYANVEFGKETPLSFDIYEAFESNDPKKIIITINALFASMPYDLIFDKTEKYYHAILYLAFKLIGTQIQSEVKTSDGRIDAVVETDTDIWILEFKLDKSASEAMTQIKSKAYADAFKSSNKPIHAMGVNFSSVTKKVDEWEHELI
jgi:hypothetical protein